MESLYATLLSIFLVALSLFLHFIFKPSKTSFGAPLPPGSSGWPVIGESFAFLSTGWTGHPHKFFFDRIQKHSSRVFRTHLFLEKAVVFTGSDGNKFLFSNENKTVESWLIPSFDKIFPSTPQNTSKEEAIKLRKLLPGFLKPEALNRYVGLMDEIAIRHFSDSWENKENVVVLPLTRNYTFWIACRLFISVEDSVAVAGFAEPFNILVEGLISIPIDLPGTPFNKAVKASRSIRKELASIIRRRKAEMAEGTAPPQDILSHMLLTTDENGKLMDEKEIATKILGILVGGHDTTSSACTFVVKFLAEFPHVYDAVYQEQMKIAESKKEGELLRWEDIQKMKYSWNVACEVLRLYPPVQGGFREAIVDFAFNGFHIPKGWKIYWSAHSTHRSSDYYPDPDKFDPERFEGKGPAPYTFVPFGGGPRMCPGKEYARLEILVFMHHLVKRFRLEKMIADEKIVVNPFPAPAKGLPIRLFPHRS